MCRSGAADSEHAWLPGKHTSAASVFYPRQQVTHLLAVPRKCGGALAAVQVPQPDLQPSLGSSEQMSSLAAVACNMQNAF